MRYLINEFENPIFDDIFSQERYSGIDTTPPPYGSLPQETPLWSPPQYEHVTPENGENGGGGNGRKAVVVPPETPQDTLIDDGNGNGLTTLPVDESKFPMEEGQYLGGYGGGAGAPVEEEVIEEETVARVADDKILGMNPKLFYGLLAGAALVGGFIYLRKKKIIKL